MKVAGGFTGLTLPHKKARVDLNVIQGIVARQPKHLQQVK